MSDEQHKELADLLNSVQGMVAFSNYDCPLLNLLYPETRWFKYVSSPKTNHSTKDKRIEVLWTNYDPREVSVATPTQHGMELTNG